jgi:putative hemolysin
MLWSAFVHRVVTRKISSDLLCHIHNSQPLHCTALGGLTVKKPVPRRNWPNKLYGIMMLRLRTKHSFSRERERLSLGMLWSAFVHGVVTRKISSDLLCHIHNSQPLHCTALGGLTVKKPVPRRNWPNKLYGIMMLRLRTKHSLSRERERLSLGMLWSRFRPESCHT